MIDLRLGRWEDVLDGVHCDAVVVDPPFGKRVHEFTQSRKDRPDVQNINRIDYEHWTPDDVAAFVKSWSSRCRGWMAALTSHDLIDAWESAYEDAGRYSFAPVPCVIRGMTVRMSGDGPSSWAVYAMVSRPRSERFCGGWTNPGAYVGGRGVNHATQGADGSGRGKPEWLMNAIIRDYTRPGDLVVDPCAGYGSTLIAASSLGRRAIGAEVDAEVHAEALKRCARPQQTDLFAEAM